MANCPVCSLIAEPNYSITGDICKHTFHVDCAGPSINYDHCPACLNKDQKQSIGTLFSEPHTLDGIDYVIFPGEKKKDSILRNGISSVVSIMSRTKDKKTETPFDLLKKRIPVETIMKKYGYGLDHMLKEGVDIDDFLSNGYKWNDLILFEDISKNGPNRSLQTFTNGLNLNASHLKTYSDWIPIDKFRKLTQISGSQFNTLLGLRFEEDGPLSCHGMDFNWDAKDCVKLGLKMSDLLAIGMVWIEQYQDLMSNLTQEEQIEAENALQVSVDHLKSLESCTKLQEEQTKRAVRELKRLEEKERSINNFQVIEEEDEPPFIEEENQFYFEKEQHHDEPVVTKRSVARQPKLNAKPTTIEDLIIPQAPVAKQKQQTKVVEHVPIGFRRKQKKN
jgi:hypothetical protein